MRKGKQVTDECEDYCFSCKDGGEIRGCDYKNCLKSYHPECVGKEKSFLDSNEKWECAWHKCSICNNNAIYKCYCCPTSSFCHTCIKDVEFVPIKKQNNMGFCNNCLRLAILIEENIDVDSDGGKVDFTDTETYEFLFKEYWEIVKEIEGLSLLDLKAANRYLKKGQKNTDPCDSAENEVESEKMSEEYNPESSDSFLPDSGSRKRKSSSKKEQKSKSCLFLNKKWGVRKRNFIGWGSKELRNFLSSIGKDSTEPISQSDACGIIEGYIERNNLYHPEKKRKLVLCDQKLRALLGKGKVKTSKIYRLLESHFPGNEDSADEFSLDENEFEEEEEEGGVRKKRKSQETGPSQVRLVREQISEQKRRCRASLVKENIKIIFLRRSIVLELLKDPDVFEEKMKGCFVRVKHDPKDFYVKPRNLYQIGQVTGVMKGSEEYKVGDFSTNILLEISNFFKDMKLSSLTEEEFDEMDLDDFKELARKGLYKMPTVGEIEEKLKSIHKLIMSDSIERELVRLPKLISQANAKGWWKESYDYMERIKLLQKPEEKERLITEMPLIIADPEEEAKEEKIEEKQGNKRGKTVLLPDSPATPVQNKVIAKAETSSQKVVPEVNGNAETSTRKAVPEANGSAQIVAETETREDDGLAKDESLGSESSDTPKPETNGNGSTVVLLKEKSKEIKVNGANLISTIEATSMQIEEIQNPNSNPPNENNQTLNLNHPELSPQKVTAKDPVVIDLSDSDEEQNEQNTPKQQVQRDSEFINSLRKDQNTLVWYYMDPQGEQQGPFSIQMLRKWRDLGFFDDDFRVWHIGQSFKDSILLEYVLRISK